MDERRHSPHPWPCVATAASSTGLSRKHGAHDQSGALADALEFRFEPLSGDLATQDGSSEEVLPGRVALAVRARIVWHAVGVDRIGGGTLGRAIHKHIRQAGKGWQSFEFITSISYS